MPPASSPPAKAFEHCAELVRSRDPERATAALFAPVERQPWLLALAAFDLETASIPDHVSQPLPGEIRLQWWRDLLETGEGGAGSPVAEALLATVRDAGLPIPLVDRFLEARIFDLYDDPMLELVDLETYAGETRSTLLSLSARSLSPELRAPSGDVAGHGGIAATVCRVLELAVRSPQRAQKFIPEPLFTAAGATRSDWAGAPARHEAVGEALAAFGQDHLAKALADLPRLDRAVRPAFLPLTMLDQRLENARSALNGRSGGGDIGALRRSYAFWRAMRARP